MRKECKQTFKETGLMQTLKGGWRKKAKKVLAGVLAGAMVLTSGVVIPQNATVAEAADSDISINTTIGTHNADGSYSLGYGDSHFDAGTTGEGDFSKTVRFHQDSQVASNWHAYVVRVASVADPTNNWVTRPDYYTIVNFAGCTDVKDGGPDWNTYAAIMQNAEVAITVSRTGSTVTVAHSAVNADGQSFSFTYHVDNAPTGDLNVYIGGEACQLTAPSPTGAVRKINISYEKANGSEVAPSVSKNVFEGCAYSIPSPVIDGFNADKTTVSGVAGASDENIVVTYTSAAKHTLTVDYVKEDGTSAADSKTQEIDEGKEYSIKSPAVKGYKADKTTVSGTMGADDNKVTVTYKPVVATVGTDNGDGTYTAGWNDYTIGRSIVKKAGDFSVGFSFHSDSAGAGPYQSFGVGVSTNLAATMAGAGDWFMTSDARNNGCAFEGSEITYSGYNAEGYTETIKDAEVAVAVTRKDTTMTISTAVTGANGKTYSWSAEATNCPTGKVAIFLGADSSLLSLYSESESDSFEKHKVTIHYAYEDGTQAAEDVVKEVEEGLGYSVKSPVISGYQADSITAVGTVGTEDKEVTVTYKKVIKTISTMNSSTGAYEGGWWIYKDGYQINKFAGNFTVAYSFHTQTNVDGAYASYGIGLTTNSNPEYNQPGDWFMTSAAGNLTTFAGSEVTFDNNFAGNDDWASYKETIKDAEVTVSIERKGTTITIATNIVGANGKTFFGTATATGCPGCDLGIYLTADWSELSLYSASESDQRPIEAYPLTIHYVYADGTKAADDVDAGKIQRGALYEVKSPEIEGYRADQPVVAGVMGDKALEITVTYKKKNTEPVATVGQKNEDGSYTMAWNDYTNFYRQEVSGDFEVTFQFHNSSAGKTNYENYAVALSTNLSATAQSATDWYMRADRFDNSTFSGSSVTYADNIVWGDDFKDYQDLIKDSDVTVTVSRTGSTITITNSVQGANGKSYSSTATATNCPTDDLVVFLGGENCQLTLYDVSKGDDVVQPTDKPAEPTTEPTEPTAEPTDEPTNPTATPSSKPVVKKGDKVNASNATFKVTSTKDKTVAYTDVKSSSKKSITVPNTIKVTTGGKKVTYKVTAITKETFKNNKKVEKIVIGENITKIEAGAFKNCKNLTTIVIKSKNLTSVGKNILQGTAKKLVIKVPAKKLAAYKKLFSGKGNSNVVVKKA